MNNQTFITYLPFFKFVQVPYIDIALRIYHHIWGHLNEFQIIYLLLVSILLLLLNHYQLPEYILLELFDS